MTPSDDGRNPLSPYYPSEVPSVRGHGRRWFAVLVALLLLGTTFLALVLPLLAFLPP
ncbi:hypothetical protein U3A55_02700 [Salarchaeum sp. III]|uniref:hypothetical protein n=1 Tax=Salarchaeum sp. III TaxID=3107927 RepID=UPI002EDB0E05